MYIVNLLLSCFNSKTHACCYLSFFYLKALKDNGKRFLFHLNISFCYQDIYGFAFSFLWKNLLVNIV